MYVCPECGYASEENGNCPLCEAQMEERRVNNEEKDGAGAGS